MNREAEERDRRLRGCLDRAGRFAQEGNWALAQINVLQANDILEPLVTLESRARQTFEDALGGPGGEEPPWHPSD